MAILLAALRGGITDVIIPHDNERDLQEIPSEVTRALTIHPVRWIDEVFALALSAMPAPVKPKKKRASPKKLAKTAAKRRSGRRKSH